MPSSAGSRTGLALDAADVSNAVDCSRATARAYEPPDIRGETGTHLAGTSRRLEQRHPGSRRRARATCEIGGGSNNEPDRCQPNDQRIDRIAAYPAPTFAREIADIAVHEQISRRSTRQSLDTFRIAGDEPPTETECRPADLLSNRTSDRHLLLQLGRNFDPARLRKSKETLGELDVARRQGFADFARNGCGIKCLAQPQIGKPLRLVGGQAQSKRESGARPDIGSAACKQCQCCKKTD